MKSWMLTASDRSRIRGEFSKVLEALGMPRGGEADESDKYGVIRSSKRSSIVFRCGAEQVASTGIDRIGHVT